MKGYLKFIIGFSLFFALVFILQLQMPKSFHWEPTFDHRDAQPFGTLVFDSVVSSSMHGRYHVCNKSFKQLDNEYRQAPIGVLMAVNELKLSRQEVHSLLKIARRGGCVFIAAATEYLPGDSPIGPLCDSLAIRLPDEGQIFNLHELRQEAADLHSAIYDTLYWQPQDTLFPPQRYHTFGCLVSDMSSDNPKATMLAYALREYDYRANSDMLANHIDQHVGQPYINNDGDTVQILRAPIALSVPVGRGRVVITASPLLLTNYGILQQGTTFYIGRLLSQFGHLPVYRTEYYNPETNIVSSNSNESPLRYFLSHAPLRWALYLSVLGMLLFTIQSARRQQRIIPILPPLTNRSLEFVRLIGTLYARRADHVGLVRMKYRFFADRLQRQLGVDVDNVHDNGRAFDIVAHHTGIEHTEVERIIRDLRVVSRLDGQITPTDMHTYINNMNKILKAL